MPNAIAVAPRKVIPLILQKKSKCDDFPIERNHPFFIDRY